MNRFFMVCLIAATLCFSQVFNAEEVPEAILQSAPSITATKRH